MVQTAEIVQSLQQVPLFQELNKRQLHKLADRCVERSYPAGAEIVTQGTGGEGFFVILAGKAEAIRTRSDGEQVVVNTFYPAAFFGEMALLDAGLRTATVRTIEPTECLVLTRWDFLSVLKEDADLAITILQELARRFRATLDRLS